MGSVPSCSTHPGESQMDQHVKVRAGALAEAAHCHPGTAIPPLPSPPQSYSRRGDSTSGDCSKFHGPAFILGARQCPGCQGRNHSHPCLFLEFSFSFLVQTSWPAPQLSKGGDSTRHPPKLPLTCRDSPHPLTLSSPPGHRHRLPLVPHVPPLGFFF